MQYDQNNDERRTRLGRKYITGHYIFSFERVVKLHTFKEEGALCIITNPQKETTETKGQ